MSNGVEKKQFLYVLRLVPELLDESNWTEQKEAIVGEHFARLQGLLAEGRLILAGRTLDDNPQGLVILEVGSEEEARELMETDPAVAQGVMTAQLFPYRVALSR